MNILFILILVLARNVAAVNHTRFDGCQQSFFNGSIMAISFNTENSTCTDEEIESIGEMFATVLNAPQTTQTGLEISLVSEVCPDSTSSTDVSTKRYLALKGTRELSRYIAKYRFAVM